jgi:hypothetical protein
MKKYLTDNTDINFVVLSLSDTDVLKQFSITELPTNKQMTFGSDR